MDADACLRTMVQRLEIMVCSLSEFVQIESGSMNKLGVDRVGGVLASRFEKLGFTIRVLPERTSGDHLVAIRRGRGRGTLLFMLHLDTIWPAGSIRTNPFHIRGGKAYGPGVLDMKGGWVVLLSALEYLGQAGLDMFDTVTVFMTGDEELGSVTARKHIVDIGRSADWALVMEPAREDGALVTQRGAVGAVRVEVRGVMAHSSAIKRGASAIVGACKVVSALDQLNDPERGMSVNVGLLSGGAARQVVADRALLSVDLRAPSSDGCSRLLEDLRSVVARELTADALESVVEGGVTRPAFVPNERSQLLFTLAYGCAQQIGVSLSQAGTSGGSDGNLVADCGVTTLDGLGAEGAGMCTTGEYVQVESLPRRSALLALIVAELGSRCRPWLLGAASDDTTG